MELETRIKQLMAECAAMSGQTLVPEVTNDLVLLESGLDSLGFATLVVRPRGRAWLRPLHDAPSDVVYPRTFGEFVAIYRDATSALGSNGSGG